MIINNRLYSESFDSSSMCPSSRGVSAQLGHQGSAQISVLQDYYFRGSSPLYVSPVQQRRILSLLAWEYSIWLKAHPQSNSNDTVCT